MNPDNWNDVNKALGRHGLPFIVCIPAEQVPVKGKVMFDKPVAMIVKQNILSLIKDSERRHELIKNLLITNNRLKEDLNLQMNLAGQFQNRVLDLKKLLENAKLEKQQLEELLTRAGTQVKELQYPSDGATKQIELRYHHLQEVCRKQEMEIVHLQTKIMKLTENIEGSSQLNKSSDLNKNLVDIKVDQTTNIEESEFHLNDYLKKLRLTANVSKDSTIESSVSSNCPQCYELQIKIETLEGNLAESKKEIEKMDNEMELLKLETNSRLTDSVRKDSTVESSVSSNYPQCYELQIKIETLKGNLAESKKEMEKMDNEMELLKLEINSRPEIKVFREAQKKIKKLEKLLSYSKKNHVMTKDVDYTNLMHNLHVMDVGTIPDEVCHQLIKDIATELNVDHLGLLIPHLRTQNRNLNAYPKMNKLLNEILSEVIPITSNQQASQHEIWCDSRWYDVIPVLRQWRHNTENLEHLQKAINSLIVKHFPRHQRLQNQTGSKVKLEKLINLLYKLSKEYRESNNVYKEPTSPPKNGLNVQTSNLSEKNNCHHDPPYDILAGMIQHFQTLFDVPSIDGVYLRMQDVYCHLGEVKNVLNTLRTILEIDLSCRISSIIDTVADMKVVLSSPEFAGFKQLLQKESMNSILTRLQQHRKFLPVFQSIIMQIMDIIGVEDIDKVLPAIQGLKGIHVSNQH